MSWHQGPMLALDTETSGVSIETDRIVTACAAMIDGTGRVPPDVTTWLADPGIDIPAGATAIHGISTEHARECGEPPMQVLGQLVADIEQAQHNGVPIVGFNLPFDLSIIDRECRRHIGYGLEDVLGQPLGPIVDAMVLDKAVSKRRGSRKLVDVCAHYEVTIDVAHDAAEDALAAARVAWRIAHLNPRIASMSLMELHGWQVKQKKSQDISLAGYFRRKAQDAKTVDEQTDLWARAESCTGAWPLVPVPAGAPS